VAHDFSYTTLQEYFHCAKNTITAARVHATVFGRGGVPPQGLKFTRQVLSEQVIEEFVQFLHRDDVSRPSSCRSVLVEGKETAVRYWQYSLKRIVHQYSMEFPNGVKRTYIYIRTCHRISELTLCLQDCAQFVMIVGTQTSKPLRP